MCPIPSTTLGLLGWRRTLLLSAAVLAACKGADAPRVPTTLEAAGTPMLSGTVGTPLATAPVILLKDQAGRGMAGVMVRWSVFGGGKVTNDSVRTDASGSASSGGWTLGGVAGTQTLRATAASLTPVTFTATVLAGPAQRLVRLTTDPQTATVNANVPLAPSVRAVDQYDNPVPGVAVTFSAVVGGGTIVGGAKSTGTDGVATADAWKLGTGIGQQVARADAPGVSIPTAFSANALAGPASSMTSTGEVSTSGFAGAQVLAPPSVRVVDAFANPVANLVVTFTPGTNSGSVTGSTTFTNENGIASVGAWTLGTGNAQTLTAAIGGGSGLQVVFTLNLLATDFQLVVRYVGAEPSARQKLAVDRAVQKWRSVIVAHSGITRVITSAAACGRSWTPAVDESVADLLILARIAPIDGINGVLGNANACRFHANGLTSLGTMQFDSEDLASLEGSGLIDAVVAHEMGHSLGIGTLWVTKAVMADFGGIDPIFTGATTLAQFIAIGGGGYGGRPVPIENTGGSGTANSHWRESVFRNELMTGFLNNGVNPLSRVSVASLGDLGYSVSFAGSDSFALFPGLSALFQSGAGSIALNLGDDIAPIPAEERRHQ